MTISVFIKRRRQILRQSAVLRMAVGPQQALKSPFLSTDECTSKSTKSKSFKTVQQQWDDNFF